MTILHGRNALSRAAGIIERKWSSIKCPWRGN